MVSNMQTQLGMIFIQTTATALSLHTILAVPQANPLRKGNVHLLKSLFIGITEAATFYCANSSYCWLEHATVHSDETKIFLDEE